MARTGEDVNLAVAKDASITKGVMLSHYVAEDEPELRAKADRTYRRICDGLTASVAAEFGHVASEVESLEQRLRDATSGRDWKTASRLISQLAKQDRAAVIPHPKADTEAAKKSADHVPI